MRIEDSGNPRAQTIDTGEDVKAGAGAGAGDSGERVSHTSTIRMPMHVCIRAYKQSLQTSRHARSVYALVRMEIEIDMHFNPFTLTIILKRTSQAKSGNLADNTLRAHP